MKNILFSTFIASAVLGGMALSTHTAQAASNDIDKQIESYRQMAKSSIRPANCSDHLPVSLTAGGSCYTAQGYVGVKKGSVVTVYAPKTQKVVYTFSLNKKIAWQGRSIDPKSFLP